MKRGTITEEGGNLFRVFDLSGKPIHQYQLDCHITGFCVNETTQTVIATDANNEQWVMFPIN